MTNPKRLGAANAAGRFLKSVSESDSRRASTGDGISQNLELFGKTFHVQTESQEGEVRTEVFLGGRVVATRSATFREGKRPATDESRRRQMTDHHQNVVAGILERIEKYRWTAEGAPGATVVKLQDRRRAGAADGRGQRSTRTAPPREARETSIRVRDLVTEFRRRIATSDGGADAERLERSRVAFDRIVASPDFQHVRVDEQLRIQLLKTQIETWRTEGSDPRRGELLWSEVATLSRHLAGINRRAEFASITKHGASPDPTNDPDSSTSDEPRASPSPRPKAQEPSPTGSPKEILMAKVSLEPLTAIEGFMGACLVDSDSGMMLGAQNGGPVNLELAAAGNTQVVRAKRKTMGSLKLNDRIEDILVSLGKQYHLIRMLESNDKIFIYLVLDRDRSNLAMARHELRAFEADLNLN